MSMSNLWTGPFAKVEIADIRANTVHTMLAPEFPFITGVSIVLRRNVTASINVSMEAPFEEGMRMLDSTLFNTGNLVAVKMGYQGGAETKWHYGMLKQEGMQMALSADGLSGSLGFETADLDVFKVKQGMMKSKTPKDALAEIAESLGRELVIGDVADIRLGVPWGFEQVYALQSYWDSLLFICNKFGVSFYFDSMQKPGGKRPVPSLVISAWGDQLTKEKVPMTFLMRGGFNAMTNEYPLLSFSPSNAEGGFSTANGSGSRGVESVHVDQKTGDAVVVKSGPKDVSVEAGQKNLSVFGDGDLKSEAFGGFTVSKRLKADESMDVLPRHGREGKEETQRAMGALFTSDRFQQAIRADCETIGNPMLVPEMMVGIRGCGLRYDGVFVVDEVTHTFGSGEFSTSFAALNNGLFSMPDTMALAPTKVVEPKLGSMAWQRRGSEVESRVR
jgi:hypothetical protein